MKRCFFLLLAVCALHAGGAEPSTTVRSEGWGVDARTPVFGGGVTVTELPPALRGAASVAVPHTIVGRPVTALAPGLFEGRGALERVSLPVSLKEVPERAFRGCVRLRAVELPAAVEAVGARAFEDCRSLREARFGAATASIGARAFAGCDSLAEATFPTALSSVGDGAFAGCDSLRRAMLPAGGGAGKPLRIGSRAFSGCTALAAAGFDGEGPLELGDGVFEDCTALAEVWLGGTVRRLGEGLFRGCRSLRSAIVPPGATALPRECFAGCSALSSLRLPETLVSFGEGALRGCASLRELALPPQFALAGPDSLRGCTALRRLELPSGAVRFGRGALAGCDALLVSWASADPATSAGVPAASLAARGMMATGDGRPASAPPWRPHAAAAEPVEPAVPRPGTPHERAGGATWYYRPAPEGDGAEVVAAVPDEPPFENGRPEARFSLSIGRFDPILSLDLGERGPADLRMPEKLGGMPVVSVGRGAMAGIERLRLAVPATVRRIGAGAVPAAGLERLAFLGPPPRLDPGWAAPDPDAPDDDPADFLEYPAAFAREWATVLAPALPSAEPEDPDAPPEGFVGEEEREGVRWTYSVRDGRAWAGAGPGRPAVPPGTAGDLELPATLGGLPVGGVARGAFRGIRGLRSLRVAGARPDFEIAEQAFLGCTALTNVALDAESKPAAVGAEAFRGCTALERFDARGVRVFGPAAFAGCVSLRELRLGATASSPGPDALPPLFAAGCRSLAEADLPVGVVGRGAFRGCTSLREVRFSPLLRILGADAFAGCTSLRRADVPGSCTRIGPGAFDDCPPFEASRGERGASAPAPASENFTIP